MLRATQTWTVAQAGSLWQEEETQEGEAEQAQKGQALVLSMPPTCVAALVCSGASASSSALLLRPQCWLCILRT